MLRLVYLEQYQARKTGFFSRKSEWGPPHSEKSERDLVRYVCDIIIGVQDYFEV